MSREQYIVKRIEMIEGDLEQLKKFVSTDGGKAVSLLGVWRGLDIPDEDIEEAKRSLFKDVDVDDAG